MVMVYVPQGNFTMGSNDGYYDEKPEHVVYLDSYWIDQTEVTNAMYARCMRANACNQIANGSYAGDIYYGNPQYDKYPVINVNWMSVHAYCLWAGACLPTEAEWEKAARGPDANVYPWGNYFDGTIVNFCDKSCDNSWVDNYYDDHYSGTSPVGSYPAGVSLYGALDMGGNVMEWVADWYDESYYFQSPASNPTGPSSGIDRVTRGGSFNFSEYDLRSDVRKWFNNPSTYSSEIGFRCARGISP
jgi:formylglycine-generating enzyme required for sulfatase activity